MQDLKSDLIKLYLVKGTYLPTNKINIIKLTNNLYGTEYGNYIIIKNKNIDNLDKIINRLFKDPSIVVKNYIKTITFNQKQYLLFSISHSN